MGIVDRINNNLKALYDVNDDPIYKSLICDKDGVIPTTITKPTDIDIGAIASPIEYLRLLSIDLITQLYIDEATGEFLKYQLEEFFSSLRLEDETDAEWVQRTIATILQQKVSRASIIYSLRPYSSQEPEITNIIQESAFADFCFADVYSSATFDGYTVINNNYDVWSAIAATEDNQWTGIAYGNGVFVAVALDGTNRAMRSTDYGLTWSAITAAENNQWASITYGNGIFVAVAILDGTNRVMRSTDYGLTWSAIAAAENNLWYSIAYGNGVFVAVAGNGTNRVMRSTDYGLTWSAIAATENNLWIRITYGNGVFVAVAITGTNRVMRSTDYGLTWSAIAATENNLWTGIAYGNGIFVAVAGDGTNRVMRSTDYGLTWSAIAAAENNLWYSIAYGNGVFVAVASDGTNRVMRSSDYGLTWSAITAAEDNQWASITYGNGVFVALAADGTNRVMRSFHSETFVEDTIIILPAIAENNQSSYFTIKITLYDTTVDDIWTVQNIIEKIIAAGITYILEIQYT